MLNYNLFHIIFIIYNLSFLFFIILFGILILYILYHKVSSTSHGTNYKIQNFPSPTPPKPPKKNWKKKLKEHLIKYQNEYMIATVILISIGCVYYYFSGSSSGSGTGSTGSVSGNGTEAPSGPSPQNGSRGYIPSKSMNSSASDLHSSDIILNQNLDKFLFGVITATAIFKIICSAALLKNMLFSIVGSNINAYDLYLLKLSYMHYIPILKENVGAMLQYSTLNNLVNPVFNSNIPEFRSIELILNRFNTNNYIPEDLRVDENFTFDLYQQYASRIYQIAEDLQLHQQDLFEQDQLYGRYFNRVLYPYLTEHERSLAIANRDLNVSFLRIENMARRYAMLNGLEYNQREAVVSQIELLKTVTNYISNKIIQNSATLRRLPQFQNLLLIPNVPSLDFNSIEELNNLRYQIIFQALKLYIVNFDLHDFEHNPIHFQLILNFYNMLINAQDLPLPPLTFIEFFCFLNSVDVEDPIHVLSANLEPFTTTLNNFDLSQGRYDPTRFRF